MRATGYTLLLGSFLTSLPPLIGQEARSQGVEFFEKRIRPVLAEKCYRCHSEEARKNHKLKGELLVDGRAGLVKGGATGPAIVPGKPDQSLLIKALRYDGDVQMPPSGKLPDAVVRDFIAWIKAGAPDPRDGKQPTLTDAGIDWNKARQFWAFQAPTKHPLATVKDTAWPQRTIDHFILAELEKRNLQPARRATKRELIRRATFDLIGLPPTPEEIDTYLKDASPEAFARVVDRLLASPHYGERWGRYWLDIARYAEDKALAFANSAPHAYRYRDWVVQALNNDMPYDRFLRLQLAGDLLADAGPDYFVKLAGLGFQGLGQEYHKGSVAAQVMADELDDRIDTLSRGLLGLTVSCARCHDHKYDPVPTRDYYSLAAAYNGSNLQIIPLADPATVARHKAWEQKAKDMEAKLKQWLKDQADATILSAVADTGRYLQVAWQLRVLQQHKRPVDVDKTAEHERLQPFFLRRAVKFLGQGKLDSQDPAVRAWLMVARELVPRAPPTDAGVPVPVELRKATDELSRALASALKQKQGKSPSNLMKTLRLDSSAIFYVDSKQAAQILPEFAQVEYAKRKAALEVSKKDAPPAPPLAHGVSGGGKAMPVYVRGNVERQGEPAPPGFLHVLSAAVPANAGKFTRLELAEAIASPKNPLTARVLVNRVWQYHFGRGIVGTSSNFGKLGDRPSHPELLDDLAVRFVGAGWSLRWLHRELMLSSTYQLSSASVSANAEKDPDNVYLWRYAPRRLDFEAWRDAWLAVAGRLDPTLGGPSLELDQPANVRRTLYAKVSRQEPNKLLILFDFPDANVTSDRRNVTTVPQQQLFVFNSAFTIETAKAFAHRLERSAPKTEDRIALAFRLAYGREPSPEEMQASLDFVRSANRGDGLDSWQQFGQAILAANEFLWID